MMRTTLLAAALICAVMAQAAHAGAEAGKLVAVEGTVEIVRDGAKVAAAVGTAIQVDDRIRTGADGRARLSFTDGSTVSLAEGSDFTIDKHVFDPAAGKIETVLQLLQGKLRAIVSEYYGEPSASYLVETPGAVSGVRGTDFVVEHRADETTVVGLSGRVAVRGLRDPGKHEVLVTESTVTNVVAGRLPSAARALGPEDRARYLEGLQLSGIGAAAATIAAGGLTNGSEIPESEQAPVAVPPAPPAEAGSRSVTPGDAAGQSIPALQGPGGIQVPF